ncbi:hypothetical protein N7492_003612 [Penicillium capsulatum]|uniref:FAD-binding domain-containing protein n=1 Tax=Penicillium capsulatum TaxID=69766 RepID=A0A9W9IMD8_9EURO|nr:hypothetical protein N7492_003612 [Penicillium capsulatum]KAJ6121805.1 hypothetical protein N7512_004270 [Penicillium capsulatum]
MSDSPCETTDVVICGCGPTGAALSAFLGRMNIRNVVLEKAKENPTDFRGIALDEDGIRVLQAAGIYPSIYRDIGSCMQTFKFIGGSQSRLDKRPFLEMDYSTTEGGTGHVGFICHKQPALEKRLREAMAATTYSDLRCSSEVTNLVEDDQGMLCEYLDSEGTKRQIRSRFVVGADGKTGFTRKRYLEPHGVKLEQAHRAFYNDTWVAVNYEISLPTPKSHPNFPLWELGFSPEDVYDCFFPSNFRFLCNPKRPSVCGRFGLSSDRLWRFEFKVHADEDGNHMSQSKQVEDIIFPYLTHSGRRYGLRQSVSFPKDCVQVLQSRAFIFSARLCNRWFHGRTMVCGDAAHVFPPFGGQGISSGLRDASSLAWRLALLCRSPTQHPPSIETVLTAWCEERKQQLAHSLATTLDNGRSVMESNPVRILLRNFVLWLLQLVPRWRRDLRLGRRKEGMARYEHSGNMPFLPDYRGGICLPQVYCRPVKGADGEVLFTDDVIFSPSKIGLFQLLVYVPTMADLTSAKNIASEIDVLSKGEVKGSDATFLVEDIVAEGHEDASGVYRLATGEEFTQSALCDGRPAPQYYDPYYLAKVTGGTRFILLRPDRFVFAMCDTREELKHAAGSLEFYLQKS